ncbi:MAG: GNAT family N-acetyltransferase [Leptospiraceae bacterium]|nr:GNAT family N-acetyltransferase [Leptospiraceae bacterium]
MSSSAGRLNTAERESILAELAALERLCLPTAWSIKQINAALQISRAAVLYTIDSISDAIFDLRLDSDDHMVARPCDMPLAPTQFDRLTSGLDAYLIYQPGTDFYEILRLGVHPAVRRQGRAHSLLHALLRLTSQRILLEVSSENAAALALYSRSGFTEIHRRQQYYGPHNEAVIMEHPGRGPA